MTILMRSIDGGVTQVRVDGAMTIYEAARDRQDLLAALRARVPLAVDLSGVEEIDTAGVQLLVLARREAARNGLAFLVTSVSLAAAEALGRYGFGEDLELLGPARTGTRERTLS